MTYVSPLRIDSLYVSIWGMWRPEPLDRVFGLLQQGRAAKKAFKRDLVHFPFDTLEGPKTQTFTNLGPGRNGELMLSCSAFTLYLVPIPGSPRPEGQAQVRVEFRAEALHATGPRALWEATSDLIKALVLPTRTKVNQLHICVDQAADDPPDWPWFKDRYVTRAGCAAYEQDETTQELVKIILDNDTPMTFRLRGRRLQQILWGQRPTVELAVYNKTRQIRVKPEGAFIAEHWRHEGWTDDMPDVWRTELRLWADAADERGLHDLSDLWAPGKLASIWAWGTGFPTPGAPKTPDGRQEGFVRVVQAGQDQARDRPPTPFWQNLWSAIPQDTPRAGKQPRVNRPNVQRLIKQTIGLFWTAAASAWTPGPGDRIDGTDAANAIDLFYSWLMRDKPPGVSFDEYTHAQLAKRTKYAPTYWEPTTPPSPRPFPDVDQIIAESRLTALAELDKDANTALERAGIIPADEDHRCILCRRFCCIHSAGRLSYPPTLPTPHSPNPQADAPNTPCPPDLTPPTTP